MKILKNEEMKNYSNMKIGGIAKEVIFIESPEEASEVIKTRDKIFYLGNGTNTLINDGFLDMTFVSVKQMQNVEYIETKGEYDYVKVESGLDMDDFIDYMRQNNYTGLENIAGIPGSVGGLVNMNGGAYGTEISDCIEYVQIADEKGDIKNLYKDDLKSKYRTTVIKENGWLVLSTVFKFKKGFDEECVQDKLNQRDEKHPLDLPNLGSTFKNPEGDFAARLIAEIGLKNYRVGDAMISEKHPNFIVNLGNAKFDDVISIIEHVKKEIKKSYNIELNTEVIILK